MIHPSSGWCKFNNPEIKLHYMKKWRLIAPKATSIKTIIYSGAFVEQPTVCNLVGHINDITAVIDVQGELHCINPDYLSDMQKGHTKTREQRDR